MERKKSNCHSKLVIRFFRRSHIWTKNKSLFAIDKRHALHAKLDLLWLHFDFVWLYDVQKFQHIDSWLMTALYQSKSCTKKIHHWNIQSNFFSRIHFVFCNLGQFNNNNFFFYLLQNQCRDSTNNPKIVVISHSFPLTLSLSLSFAFFLMNNSTIIFMKRWIMNFHYRWFCTKKQTWEKTNFVKKLSLNMDNDYFVKASVNAFFLLLLYQSIAFQKTEISLVFCTGL